MSVVPPLEEAEVSSSSESMGSVSSLDFSNMSVDTVRVGPVSGRARGRVVGLRRALGRSLAGVDVRLHGSGRIVERRVRWPLVGLDARRRARLRDAAVQKRTAPSRGRAFYPTPLRRCWLGQIMVGSRQVLTLIWS